MMQTGGKFLFVLAAVLIVLAFLLKAVIPQTYRLGLGAYFYRLDSIVFWVRTNGGPYPWRDRGPQDYYAQ